MVFSGTTGMLHVKASLIFSLSRGLGNLYKVQGAHLEIISRVNLSNITYFYSIAACVCFPSDFSSVISQDTEAILLLSYAEGGGNPVRAGYTQC